MKKYFALLSFLVAVVLLWGSVAALRLSEGIAFAQSRMISATPLVLPPPNSHQAPLTSTISIAYTATIAAAPNLSQTFAVYAMQTGQLTQTYRVSGTQIALMPSRPLHAGEWVQTSATSGTLLVGEQNPVAPIVWQFRAAVPRGLGLFVDSGQRLLSGRTYDVALGDLDADGDLDAFITHDSTDAEIWLNDGAGEFHQSNQSLRGLAEASVALGDLDHDGDLDAFITRHNDRPSAVLLNDSHGHFTDTLQGLGHANSLDAALGDLDRDGDLDAFVANGYDNQPEQVWLNDGTGIFTAGQSLGSEQSNKVALGDLDNDGDLDAFVVNGANQADRVWLNDGTGHFIGTFQGLGVSSGSDVLLGDLDGDPDLDVIVVNYEGSNQVWLNNGAGIFATGQSFGTGETNSYYAADLGDLDHDGDLDLVLANYQDVQLHSIEVWLNDGHGQFRQSTQRLGHSHSRRVTLGDLNGDGALDIFVGNDLDVFGLGGQTKNEVWFNTTEQIFLPTVLK